MFCVTNTTHTLLRKISFQDFTARIVLVFAPWIPRWFFLERNVFITLFVKGVTLWEFIPKTICLCWIDEVIILLSFNEFTMNDTSPISENKTSYLFRFDENYN